MIHMVPPRNEPQICFGTYIAHEKNYKDEILIRHLMQVSPWKVRHENVKSTWE